jgi:hypothetical protein
MVCVGISLNNDGASTDVWENVPKLQFEGYISRGSLDFRAWLINLRRRSE